MSFFPAQYSTLSAVALNERIQHDYNLRDTTCKYLLRGVSDTYRIDGKEANYIFRVYRQKHRSLNEIKGEIELLNALQAAGAKIACAIKDRNGAQIQEFQAAEGIRYGVLFSFAQGKSGYLFTDKQLKTIGREMAFNHNVTSRITLAHERHVYDLDTTLVQPIKVVEPAFKEYPEGYAYLKGLAEQVIARMDSIDTTTFSTGYCHYDYLPKNFHLDEHDNLTLFDFDFAGRGLLVNDLMVFQVHHFLNILYKGISREEAERSFNTFVAGYREVRNLSDQELTIMPYLGIMWWIFFLRFQYENFDDWSNQFFGTKFLMDRVELIRKWVGMYCEF